MVNEKFHVAINCSTSLLTHVLICNIVFFSPTLINRNYERIIWGKPSASLCIRNPKWSWLMAKIIEHIGVVWMGTGPIVCIKNNVSSLQVITGTLAQRNASTAPHLYIFRYIYICSLGRRDATYDMCAPGQTPAIPANVLPSPIARFPKPHPTMLHK